MGIFSAGSAGVTIVPDFQHAQQAIGRWFAQHHATMHVDVDLDRHQMAEAADFLTGFSTTGKLVKGLFSPKTLGITDLAGAAGSLVSTFSQAAGAAALIPAAIAAAAVPIATITIGLHGMGDAFKALASGDAAKINESMKNLAPNARDFVTQIHALGPAFKDLRLDVQNTLFDGLGDSISNLAKKSLPILHTGLGDVAFELNAMTKDFAGVLSSASGMDQISSILINIANTMLGFEPAIKPLVNAFLTITNVGSSFLPGMAASFASMTQSFDRWVQGAAKSGALANIIGTGLARIKQLFDLVLNVGQTVFNLFKPALSAGQLLLTMIDQLFSGFNQFLSIPTTQSTLFSFFNDISLAIAKIEPGIQILLQALVTNFLPIAGKLANALAPLANTILVQLANMLTKIGPLIYPALVGALTAWLNAVAPLIPIFTDIAQAILPVISKVLAQLAPVVSEVADEFGKFLAKALQMLAPLLQQLGVAFVQILKALVPILPPLFQLIEALLPPLIKLIQAIIPIIVLVVKTIAPWIVQLTKFLTPILRTLADVVLWVFQKIIGPIIVWLIDKIIKPYFDAWIHVLSHLGDYWHDFTQAIQTAWHWLGTEIGRIYHGFIEPIWHAIQGALSTVKQWFKDTVSGIQTVWHGLIHALEYPVQLAINWVWNDTLRKAWNAFNNLWHGKDLGPIVLPGMNAAEGAVLPGYTPGRDVHHFYSPTAGMLNLSGGEAIMVPEFTAAVGTDRIGVWNKMARQYGVAYTRRVLGFANGGTFPDPAAAIGGVSLSSRDTGFARGLASSLSYLLPFVPGGNLLEPIVKWIQAEASGSKDKGASPIFSIVGSVIRNGLNGLWDWAKGLITSSLQPGGGTYASYITAQQAQAARNAQALAGVNLNVPAGNTLTSLSVAGNVLMGQQLAAARGWTGANWTSLLSLWNRESGWRNTAQNPTSTAFGIPQLLDGTWASTGYRKSADARIQELAGMNYISGRYGNPINAWAHEVKFGWYDRGGWIPPGFSLSYNGTGRPEAILDAAQSDRLAYVLSGASGGSTAPAMPTVVAGIANSTIHVTDLNDLMRKQRQGARRAMASLAVRK